MSNDMFPSGPWTGFYNYRPKDKHRMDLDLTFASGRMSGGGNDDVGRFVIRGQYDTQSLECWWTKSYVGAHDVFYRGFREGKGIWGTWEITVQDHGGFHIWPKRAGESETEFESSEQHEPASAAVVEDTSPTFSRQSKARSRFDTLPPHEPCSSGRQSAPSEVGKKSEPTYVGCYSSGGQCAKKLPGNSHPGPLPLGEAGATAGSWSYGFRSWQDTFLDKPKRRMLFPLPAGEGQGEGELLAVRARGVLHIPLPLVSNKEARVATCGGR